MVPIQQRLARCLNAQGYHAHHYIRNVHDRPIRRQAVTGGVLHAGWERLLANACGHGKRPRLDARSTRFLRFVAGLDETTADEAPDEMFSRARKGAGSVGPMGAQAQHVEQQIFGMRRATAVVVTV